MMITAFSQLFWRVHYRENVTVSSEEIMQKNKRYFFVNDVKKLAISTAF